MRTEIAFSVSAGTREFHAIQVIDVPFLFPVGNQISVGSANTEFLLIHYSVYNIKTGSQFVFLEESDFGDEGGEWFDEWIAELRQLGWTIEHGVATSRESTVEAEDSDSDRATQ